MFNGVSLTVPVAGEDQGPTSTDSDQVTRASVHFPGPIGIEHQASKVGTTLIFTNHFQVDKHTYMQWRLVAEIRAELLQKIFRHCFNII